MGSICITLLLGAQTIKIKLIALILDVLQSYLLFQAGYLINYMWPLK